MAQARPSNPNLHIQNINSNVLGSFLTLLSLSGQTIEPLTNAIIYQDFEMLKKLEEGGSDVNHVYRIVNGDEAIEMPTLYIAAAQGTPQILAYLLDKGARINVTDHSGQNALFSAIEANQPLNAELLIQKGIEYNCVNGAGKSPFYFAVVATYNNNAMLNVLTSKCPKIKAIGHPNEGEATVEETDEKGLMSKASGKGRLLFILWYKTFSNKLDTIIQAKFSQNTSGSQAQINQSLGKSSVELLEKGCIEEDQAIFVIRNNAYYTSFYNQCSSVLNLPEKPKKGKVVIKLPCDHAAVKVVQNALEKYLEVLKNTASVIPPSPPVPLTPAAQEDSMEWESTTSHQQTQQLTSQPSANPEQTTTQTTSPRPKQ